MEEGKGASSKDKGGIGASFTRGAIALVFIIIGYQLALFVHKAAVLRVEANRDRPDTVYVYMSNGGEDVPASPETTNGGVKMKKEVVRKNAPHSPALKQVRERTRTVESFPFNPNTVSVDDLQRLGFSEKQAQAIDNYRKKGGHFNRREDFAKSFVVADSVYSRLEKYINIPKLDINKADSVSLLALPGIGPYFAGKIVSYRASLRGYSTTSQLLDIYRFDEEKYNGLKDLVNCSRPEPYPIWTLPEEELAKHPYISKREAHGIVLFRTHQPSSKCTVEELKKSGVISEEHAGSLSKCVLASPEPDS